MLFHLNSSCAYYFLLNGTGVPSHFSIAINKVNVTIPPSHFSVLTIAHQRDHHGSESHSGSEFYIYICQFIKRSVHSMSRLYDPVSIYYHECSREIKKTFTLSTIVIVVHYVIIKPSCNHASHIAL